MASERRVKPRVDSGVADEEEELIPVYAEPPETLAESLYYLSKSQEEVIRRRRLVMLEPVLGHLPGWVPWCKIAAALGHDNAALNAAEARWGKCLWATEFENVHDLWCGFSELGFDFGGRHWRGSEQMYQALKVGDIGSPEFEAIADAFCSYSELAAYDHGRRLTLRADWSDGSRDAAMTFALESKFSASAPDLRRLLVSTGRHPLVSIKGDLYFGAGFDGTGANRLPELLQELRGRLAAEL